MDVSNQRSARLKWMALRLDPESGAISYRHPCLLCLDNQDPSGMVPLLAEPVKGKLPITTVAPIQPGRIRSEGIPLAGQPHEDPQPRWVRRAPGAKGTRRQKSEKSRPESPETMSYATRGSATAEKPPAREGLR